MVTAEFSALTELPGTLFLANPLHEEKSGTRRRECLLLTMPQAPATVSEPEALAAAVNREFKRIYSAGLEHAAGLHGSVISCALDCPKREISYGDAYERALNALESRTSTE